MKKFYSLYVYVPRDVLCIGSGDPDDRAPAVRAVKVEIVNVEHRATCRRVTRIRVTLSGLWTRGWRKDLSLAFATAVLLLFLLENRLVFFYVKYKSLNVINFI